MKKIYLIVLVLLIAPARANLIPDSFPWKPLNIDYNGEIAVYSYVPQEMPFATTLYLGGSGGYSSMNKLIKSVNKNNLTKPIRIIVRPGIYRNSWDSLLNFDGSIECESLTSKCTFSSTPKFQPQIKAKNFIIKNIIFIGGKTGLYFRPKNQSGRKDIIESKFLNSTQDDGLSVRDSGDFYIYKSEASYNAQDGFDYHSRDVGLTRIIELDVICKETGYLRSSSNCSTAHEDVQIIRINGAYTNANDRTIHDIEKSKTLIINSFVSDSRRKGNFKGPMFFSNSLTNIIMKNIQDQKVVCYSMNMNNCILQELL